MRWSELRLRKGDCSSETESPLAESSVEYRISCLVVEISENNGALVVQLWRALEIEVTADTKCQQHHHTERHNDPADSSLPTRKKFLPGCRIPSSWYLRRV